MLIITWPVVVSNLYNLKPGLLGPPGVVGDMLGAIIIQDTGRPGGTNLFCHVFTSHVRAARRWKDVRGRGRGELVKSCGDNATRVPIPEISSDVLPSLQSFPITAKSAIIQRTKTGKAYLTASSMAMANKYSRDRDRYSANGTLSACVRVCVYTRRCVNARNNTALYAYVI